MMLTNLIFKFGKIHISYAVGVACLMLASNITAQNPSGSNPGLDALNYFASVPEYLDSKPDLNDSKYHFLHVYQGAPAKQWIDLLQRNRQLVLEYLPNNPEYWRAFQSYMAGEPPQFDPSILDRSNSYWDHMAKLVSAAQNLGYRQMAMSTTRLSAGEFVDYYKNLRRMLVASGLLVDRVTYSAMVSVALRDIEGMMAIYARQQDLDSVRILASNLSPFTPTDRSLTQILAGEQKYQQAELSRLELVDLVDLFKNSSIPTDSVSDARAWASQQLGSELNAIATYLERITNKDGADYWSQGTTNSGYAFSSEEKAAPYLDYLGTDRTTEVYIYVLQALSDIYLGTTPPGVPTRPAPAFWTWSWDTTASKVCLAPTQVARGASQFSIENPACATYLPAKSH